MNQWLKKLYKFKPIAWILSALVIIGGGLLFIFKRDLQIGGILGALLGSKPTNKRAEIPEKRVDEAGKTILPGESDSKGYTQIPVSENIKKPGFFSDPNTVVIDHPTEGKQVIELPTGVKNRDVSEVIIVKPEVTEVSNNDKGVDTKYLINILK